LQDKYDSLKYSLTKLLTEHPEIGPKTMEDVNNFNYFGRTDNWIKESMKYLEHYYKKEFDDYIHAGKPTCYKTEKMSTACKMCDHYSDCNLQTAFKKITTHNAELIIDELRRPSYTSR
jgi:hypothetical protein